jgi:hypothetical protein
VPALTVVLPETSPLIHLAAADALWILGRLGRVIVVDMVAHEATAEPGKPYAAEIARWIAAGTQPNANDAVSVASTETGELVRLARQVDPAHRAPGAGETAILEWLGDWLDDTKSEGGAALVVYENGRVSKALLSQGFSGDLTVMTTRALLDMAEQDGIIDSAEALWRQILEAAPTANPARHTLSIRPTTER